MSCAVCSAAVVSLARLALFLGHSDSPTAMSKKPTSAYGFSRATKHSSNVRGSLQPSSEPPVFDKLRVRPSLQRVSALCLLPSHRARARGAGGQLHAIDAAHRLHAIDATPIYRHHQLGEAAPRQHGHGQPRRDAPYSTSRGPGGLLRDKGSAAARGRPRRTRAAPAEIRPAAALGGASSILLGSLPRGPVPHYKR